MLGWGAHSPAHTLCRPARSTSQTQMAYDTVGGVGRIMLGTALHRWPAPRSPGSAARSPTSVIE